MQCLDLVEGLAGGLRETLTNDELKMILQECHSGLEQTRECEGRKLLFKASSVDLEQAARLALKGAFGVSRWHSLQAAEKSLKVFIAAKGGTPKRTHDLMILNAEAVEHGMGAINTQIFLLAQCSPDVRYDDAECTKANSFDAHRAAWRITSRTWLDTSQCKNNDNEFTRRRSEVYV